MSDRRPSSYWRAPRGTVCVWAVRPALAALDERGVDAAAVLRAAQLSRSAVMTMDSRLPYAAMQEFWAVAAIASRDRSFGAHVAERMPKGSADLIEYLVYASATVGEAFDRVARYSRIFYDLSSVRLEREPRRVRLVRRTPAQAPQFDEFVTTFLVDRTRKASATRWLPERALFRHEREDGGELSRILGCPVEFGAERQELWVSPKVLAIKHVHADSRLLEILSRYADQLLAAIPERGDLVARALSAITRRIATSPPTLASTAAALGLHPRTLQRRLAAAGASHNELVDEVRRGLALKYIGDVGLSIGEIGYMLHYADETAFGRAFKRWTGQSPLRYRERTFTTE